MLKTLKKLRIINSWRHSKFYELWANITPENLSRLVAKGVNLNEPIKGENLPYGSKGMTAFHFLCWFQNDINTLKKAIELGADGSRTSNHGYTALMYYLDDDKLDGPEHPYNDFEKYWVSMPGSGGEIKLETCQFLVKNGSSLNHQSKAYCRRLYNDIEGPPITDKNQGGIHTLFLILRENQFALLEDLLKTNPRKDLVLHNPFAETYWTPINWAIEFGVKSYSGNTKYGTSPKVVGLKSTMRTVETLVDYGYPLLNTKKCYGERKSISPFSTAQRSFGFGNVNGKEYKTFVNFLIDLILKKYENFSSYKVYKTIQSSGLAWDTINSVSIVEACLKAGADPNEQKTMKEFLAILSKNNQEKEESE